MEKIVSTASPPVASPPTVITNKVDGRVLFENGLPAGLVTIRVYSRGFGGKSTKIAEGQTDDQGYYSLSYKPDVSPVNLEVRTVDAKGNEVPLSSIKYNVSNQEVLNLVAPTNLQPLVSEYQRLAVDMNKQIGGIEKLNKAQESSDVQDLTLLSTVSLWDARLLALASSAAQLAETTGVNQVALYGLLRSGLPADTQKLSLINPDVVQKALDKANQSGIISLDDVQTKAAIDAFKQYARKTRLTMAPTGANSTFGDLLIQSGLPPEQQDAFADLYFSSTANADDFWVKVAGLGISPEKVNNLKLQGKLAHLTINNAVLVQKLQADIGSIDNLSQLIEKDFHTATAWKNYLNIIAGPNTEALDKLIPPAYQRKTTADRLEIYAADMARKVRLSFPTQVVTRMIEKGDLSLGVSDEPNLEHNPNLTKFLKNAAPLGLLLGQTPLNSFIKQNQANLFQGIASTDVAGTSKNAKILARLWQITPSNESFQAAAKLGITSAREISSHDYQDFINYFGKSFPSIDEAKLVYRKAQQVSSVALSVYTTAKQLDNAPPVYAFSPSPSVKENAKTALIRQFPKLESLFGSLDYCECEDCRSVLSPAAYLVNLLKFLDPADKQWESFKTQWQTQHYNQSYTGAKPYDALIKRRPDLPNLPLTCENTNTIMPYIDIVNEILEYYIVNGKLDANAAYDTGNAVSDDLIAEPQNILPQAYSVLYEATYPMNLPFDLWTETVRGFLGHFKKTLWEILDLFKPADPLELFSDANNYTYYRADILAEYLGISSAEYSVFTNANIMGDWFKLYGFEDEPSALNSLKSAKLLSIRLGVSYRELVDLVSTGFLNPQLNTLVTLQKLGIQPKDVFSYEGQAGYSPMTAYEKAAFESLLDKLTKKFNPQNISTGFNARNWISISWQNGSFGQILLFADPDVGCNFESTTLQYANGSIPTPLIFLKLNFLVRIWKKLGWSIEETDRALQIFFSPNIPLVVDSNFGNGFSAAMKTALVYLAHLESIFQKINHGRGKRSDLLPLWSNIQTTGLNPLYAQLFLDSSSISSDPVFDDPVGNYLQGLFLIKDHLPALQGALTLTSNDIALILADANLDISSALLSELSVSLLYRYGLLAKALNLSVADFLDLKVLSGLNPFAPLISRALTVLAEDVPLTQTLEFVEIAGKVAESGFTIEDLKYLLRNLFDPVGKYFQDSKSTLQLIRSIVGDIRLIQSENAVPPDPLNFTDDIIKKKLALAFPGEVVQTFIGMWTGTIVYSAFKAGVNLQVDPASLINFPNLKLSYDSIKQTQLISYQGVLLDAQKNQIKASNTSQVLSDLLDEIEGQAKDFFHKYFEVSTIGAETLGFLAIGDFDLLFAPIPSGTDSMEQNQMSQKRGELANKFLPYLQQKLIRQTIVQAISSDQETDPSLTGKLTTDVNFLSDPTNPSNSLLDAFIASTENGVSATYYLSPDGSGAVLAKGTALTANTADVNEPKTAGAQSVRFEGYLEVLADGAYRFYAKLGKKDVQVKLQFDFPSDPLILATAASDNDEVSQFVDLKAGIPYQFTLDILQIGAADAELLVQGVNLPKGPLSQLTLYPKAAVDRFIRNRLLLSKTLQLIQGFGLDEEEITYFVTQRSDFNNLTFSALPSQTSDDSPTKASALFGQFLRLCDYSVLRQSSAGGTNGLIDVFEKAHRTFLGTNDPSQSSKTVLQDLYQSIANLTRRKATNVQSTAEQLGYQIQPTSIVDGRLLIQIPGLTQEKGFKRLWDALQLVQIIGIQVSDLAGVAGIIDRGKSQDIRFAIANSLKNAVSSCYKVESWRKVAASVFDKLRQEKRDALSTYLVNQLNLESIKQLFEYFLVDPDMEPVVKTSRIRLAISSVQTFVQRCLLNLEEDVNPSVIPADQWDWLKRFRVAQANLEIYLNPENYLEPEWRLNKTDLFQTLESTLLQGEVTNDLVEDAFYAYLKGMDEIARLEIVTAYLEKDASDDSFNALHVFGRNHANPKKYFYRRFALGVWTAWEPVKENIDGNHIAAVVWRDRLHIFWVSFSQKGRPTSATSVDNPTVNDIHINDLNQIFSDSAPQKQEQLQLNWIEYFQGKWTDRRSSDLTPPEAIDVKANFDPAQTYIRIGKEYDSNGNEGAVRIILGFPFNLNFRVVGKNSKPELTQVDLWVSDIDAYYPLSGGVDATKIKGSGPFQVQFTEEFQLMNAGGAIVDGKYGATVINRAEGEPTTILKQDNDFSLVLCDNTPSAPETDAWSQLLKLDADMLRMPFFYQDASRDITFFVQPWLKETTITNVKGWVMPIALPEMNLVYSSVLETLPIVSQIPQTGPRPPLDPSSLYRINPGVDWVTNSAIAISFGTSLIGQNGKLPIQAVSARAGLTTLASSSVAVTAGNNQATNSGNVNLVNLGKSGVNMSTLSALRKAVSNVNADTVAIQGTTKAQGGT